MSQRETKRHLVTGSLMHLAAKKSFTRLFKYLYPQSRRFLIFSKKTWKFWRIAGRGWGGGGEEEQGLHVCNYPVLKCDVVSFRVDDTKYFVLSVSIFGTQALVPIVSCTWLWILICIIIIIIIIFLHCYFQNVDSYTQPFARNQWSP